MQEMFDYLIIELFNYLNYIFVLLRSQVQKISLCSGFEHGLKGITLITRI